MKITTSLFSLAIAVTVLIFTGCSNPDVKDLTNALDELENLNENLDVEDALNDALGEEYTSADGNFSIKFPGNPTVESQNVPTEVGDIEMVTFMYEKSATEVYMVAYADYPSALIELSNAEDLIQGAKEGAIGEMGLQITDEEKVDINGFPGISFYADNGDYYVAYDIYLVDNRLYQVALMRDGGKPKKDAVDSFLGTFKLNK
ncbi:MAG: hypothetical protein ABIJ16_03575 [Bacteroidota bacterium]